MASLKVIGMDVTLNNGSGFLDVIALCQVGFFVFEVAEPALNYDVVYPSAFAVHALTNSVFFYEIHIALACKLVALIGI